MGETRKVRGKSLMIRVNGSTIALATNCTVDLILQTIDARTKSDPGAYEVGDIVTFNISSESVVGMNPDSVQQTHASLFSLMLSKTPVEVEVMLAANALQKIPTGDWYVGPMARKGFQSFGGQALIKQASLAGPLQGNATLQVQLGGQGALVPIAEPELTSYVEGNTLYVNGPAEIVNNSLDVEGTINDNIIEL